MSSKIFSFHRASVGTLWLTHYRYENGTLVRPHDIPTLLARGNENE